MYGTTDHVFMAEEQASISGKLGEWSVASGSLGVAGAVYRASLKYWGLVGSETGLGQAKLYVEKLATISVRLDCWGPAG